MRPSKALLSITLENIEAWTCSVRYYALLPVLKIHSTLPDTTQAHRATLDKKNINNNNFLKIYGGNVSYLGLASETASFFAKYVTKTKSFLVCPYRYQ